MNDFLLVQRGHSRFVGIIGSAPSVFESLWQEGLWRPSISISDDGSVEMWSPNNIDDEFIILKFDEPISQFGTMTMHVSSIYDVLKEAGCISDVDGDVFDAVMPIHSSVSAVVFPEWSLSCSTRVFPNGTCDMLTFNPNAVVRMYIRIVPTSPVSERMMDRITERVENGVLGGLPERRSLCEWLYDLVDRNAPEAMVADSLKTIEMDLEDVVHMKGSKKVGR